MILFFKDSVYLFVLAPRLSLDFISQHKLSQTFIVFILFTLQFRPPKKCFIPYDYANNHLLKITIFLKLTDSNFGIFSS